MECFESDALETNSPILWIFLKQCRATEFSTTMDKTRYVPLFCFGDILDRCRSVK